MGFAYSTGEKICYYIRTEGKKCCYLTWSVICIRWKNIGTDKEYINYDEKHAIELEETELSFLKTSNKPIYEDKKYDQIPT